MNCPNCGAPMSTAECEYCGFVDLKRLIYVEMKPRIYDPTPITDLLMAMGVNPQKAVKESFRLSPEQTERLPRLLFGRRESE